MRHTRHTPLAAALAAALSLSPALAPVARAQAGAVPAVPALARQVEVRRTAHGVPHIRAENLEAAAYALAYVQLEDYGPGIALGLLESRGEMGRWFGRDSLDRDFVARLLHARAVRGYPTLDRETRQVYDGFAAGVNRYVELHPEQFPAGFDARFTGHDVLAAEMSPVTPARAARFLSRLDSGGARRAPQRPGGAVPSDPAREGYEDPPDEGSNAWAFAPSRTRSGRAILLRNPHLAWTAGYYEGHVTVPGVIDFYGDFRIGGPFGVIGGFNRDLGWSTTNNDPLLQQIYALDVDSSRVDHYLLDGASVPLDRELVTAEFKNGPGLSSETRETWRTALGPVIHRGNGKIYVLRAAGDGEVRGGEQFLRMMRARSLAEWKDAMRIRARVTSNFTYADRAGNIFYVWNGSVPDLPHASGGDSVAIPVRRTSDAWTRYVPFDSLPQVLNPRGGYVHNENDPPYHTNLRQVLDRSKYPAYFPEPLLRLRSQHAVELIDDNRKLSLEDVIALKHSYRMILGDRVRDDLVAAVRASNPTGDVARAIDLIARWDKTVAPASRGGALFEVWWRRYVEGARADTMFAEPWRVAAPMRTPRGLRDPARAVEAFAWAVPETARRFGSWDVAWGDVHRVRRGSVDVPVGGCSGDIGCFRVLTYRTDADGRRRAVSGDGWVLAVEFGDQPRAYSVLAYGQSPNESSPWHADQAAMFARGEMKRVAWLERDVEAQTVKRYRPGEAR
jgi:acyl-homoserine-lactone acylase